MTVAECARRAAAMLVQAGREAGDSRRDVAVLVRHLRGWDTAAWLTRQADEVPAETAAQLDALVARRAAGEPVAYLIGEKEFYGRPFRVAPGVLIPRPETELVVEVALARIDSRARPGTTRIADAGTGSGCIAISLAAERADLEVVATDVSIDALAIAAGNARRHGVGTRIRFEHTALVGAATGLDLVVSNPPYVPGLDRGTLMPDVRDYEPALALFGGEDGLAVIARLLPAAYAALRPGGALVMEIGVDQAAAVSLLTSGAGFARLALHRDLAGIPRVVEAVRPEDSV